MSTIVSSFSRNHPKSNLSPGNISISSSTRSRSTQRRKEKYNTTFPNHCTTTDDFFNDSFTTFHTVGIISDESSLSPEADLFGFVSLNNGTKIETMTPKKNSRSLFTRKKSNVVESSSSSQNNNHNQDSTSSKRREKGRKDSTVVVQGTSGSSKPPFDNDESFKSSSTSSSSRIVQSSPSGVMLCPLLFDSDTSSSYDDTVTVTEQRRTLTYTPPSLSSSSNNNTYHPRRQNMTTKKETPMIKPASVRGNNSNHTTHSTFDRRHTHDGTETTSNNMLYNAKCIQRGSSYDGDIPSPNPTFTPTTIPKQRVGRQPRPERRKSICGTPPLPERRTSTIQRSTSSSCGTPPLPAGGSRPRLIHHHPVESPYLVEIAPGISQPVRGAAETKRAIRNHYIRICKCLNCCTDVEGSFSSSSSSLLLFCIYDADYFICPICQCINPVTAGDGKPKQMTNVSSTSTTTNSPRVGGVGGGVALGFTIHDFR